MGSIQSKVIDTKPINWRYLKFLQQDDFKGWTADAKNRLKESITANHFSQPFYVWQDMDGTIWCLDGRHRFLILNELIADGLSVPELLPATFIECMNKKEAAELVLQYSSVYARVQEQGLLDFMKAFELDFEAMKMKIDLPDFNMLDFELDMKGPDEVAIDMAKRSLQEDFIVPPFSILDTRQGYWKERRAMWDKLLPDSQETREDVELMADSAQNSEIYELRNKMRAVLSRDPSWEEILDEAKKKGMSLYKGASIFDPALCEIAYRWFNLPGGTILDPFAGGSVRGIVAGLLGFGYAGIDLRIDQVEANRKQYESIKDDVSGVSWACGDSNVVLDSFPGQYDFIFSCPPYHDLEKYSEDPADLSNMNYDEFRDIYTSIIKKSVARLKDNRFACFVVSEIRGKDGYNKGFVQDTIDAFESAGAKFYNDAVLINQIGSGAIRARRMFETNRKLCKVHQNVLVFFKGDWKTVKENYPEISTAEMVEET
jgi:DNA modification methylase